jgi:aminoglycoside phosphotransferase (APT) family kinase protein
VAEHRAGDVAQVRDVVSAELPGRRAASVVPLGAGLDNVAYEVDGDLVVRFAREPDPERTDREARLLTAVAAVATVPVPEPAFAVPELGCLAYRKLPGTPLLRLPRATRDVAVAATLGRLVAALQAAPAGLTGLVGADDEPPEAWRREAADTYPAVAHRLPPAVRGRVEAFLAAAAPDDDGVRVFCHDDLGIEHVLVDAGGDAVTGVVDWSDAALTDPARDLGRIHRDLGPAALDAALAAYTGAARRTGASGGDGAGDGADDLAALRGRALFYARCGLLEDLAHGLHTADPVYVRKSVAALPWLF